jgi:7-cyano-7-deazaguanine synthase
MSENHAIQQQIANRIVTIYSGGMDSFTMLHDLLSQGKEVFALSFNYGQRHSKELICAEAVCSELAIPSRTIDIRAISYLLAGSSLTDDIDIPEGHYEEESMKSTVVPNRNMIMLSLAIGYAVSIHAEAVYYGAHGGDHAIYPDCRPLFVERMNAVSEAANYESVAVIAPYLHMDKTSILKKGLSLGLDYGKTWTCYNGRQQACGRCGSCVERLEAFALNNKTDPLTYEPDR